MSKNIINQLAEEKDSYFNAAIPPIFSNSNFLFSNVEDMRNAMSSKSPSPFYTRGSNPTTSIFEKKIAALEGQKKQLLLGVEWQQLVLQFYLKLNLVSILYQSEDLTQVLIDL